AALIVQFTCGIGGGILAVRFPRHGGRLLLAGAQAAYAVPLFWLALLSILVFGFELGWLPAGGPGPPGERLRHLLLPVLVLGLGSAPPGLRYTRNALLAPRAGEWMTAARGRGYPPRRLLLRHGRPAVLPGLRQLLA